MTKQSTLLKVINEIKQAKLSRSEKLALEQEKVREARQKRKHAKSAKKLAAKKHAYYLSYKKAITQHLPSRIPSLIESEFGVRLWLIQMQELSLMFHLDDDPATIVNSNRPDELLFTAREVEELNKIVPELFSLVEDPHELWLEVVNNDNCDNSLA